MPLLRGEQVTRTARLVFALLLSLLSSGVFAAEKQIGNACTSDQNSADFDTIAQCQSGTFVKAPLFMGTATGYACTGGANAGLVQWTGSAFQGCDGTAWNPLTSVSSGVLLGTATGATNPQRSGDVTTGLFSPATSTVAVATAGAEALRVTATGSVGIGTQSPATPLDINGTISITGINALKLTSTGNPIVGNTGMSTTLAPLSVGIGRDALAAATTEVQGVAVGHRALASTTTGTENTAVGASALGANTTGSYNTAFGSQALRANTTASFNTGIGRYALFNTTTGTGNTALGLSSLFANTTGYSNVAVGYAALNANTVGTYNTALGYQALAAATTPSGQVAIGYQALLASTTGATNTAVGYQALLANTVGSSNGVLGYNSLSSNTTGNWNSAVGASVLVANTSGIFNVGVGGQALKANTTASYNTAIGTNALLASTTGASNTAIGQAALSINTTGSNNTVVGANVGSVTLTTGSNNILIGTASAVDTPSSSTSNWLNIGNTLYGDLSNHRIALGNGVTTIASGATLDLGGATDSLLLPKGTTAQRPSGATGMFRYNTQTGSGTPEYYDGTTWQSLLSTATGSGSTLSLGSAVTSTNPQRTGDATTGLFSPAASTVAIATAGAEALRVTATGSVGIGTTAPGFPLDIWSSAGAQLRVINSTSGTTSIAMDSASASKDVSISFYDAGATKWTAGKSSSNNYYIYDSVGTRNVLNAVSNGNLTLMQSGGNVGIGTTAPTQLLDIGSGSVKSSGLIVAGSPRGFLNPIVIGADTPTSFIYFDSTYSAMRIGMQGSAGYSNITFELPNGSGYQDGIALSNTSLVPGTPFDNAISLGSSTQRWNSLRVGTGVSVIEGQLGVGTTSPATGISLDVGGRTDSIRPAVGTTAQQPTCGVTIEGAIRYNSTSKATEFCNGTAWASLGSSSSTVLLGTATGATNPQRSGDATTGLFSPAASTVAIAAAGTEALRITATGSVGIGTTTPSNTLTIGSGNIYVSSGYLVFPGDNTGNPQIRTVTPTSLFLGANSNAQQLVLAWDGKVGIGASNPNKTLEVLDGATATIRLNSGNAAAWDFTTDFGASAPSTGDLVIGRTTGAGDFVISGVNVGIRTSSPTAALDVSGAIRAETDSYVSSTFSKTSSTALATITGLTSGTLTAGKAYAFDLWLFTTSGTSGGIKADLNGGTATATTLIADAVSMDAATIQTQTRTAALNTSLCASTTVTAATCHIAGLVIVNAAGTFQPRFAQNASNGTASTVAIGSFMTLRQLN